VVVTSECTETEIAVSSKHPFSSCRESSLNDLCRQQLLLSCQWILVTDRSIGTGTLTSNQFSGVAIGCAGCALQCTTPLPPHPKHSGPPTAWTIIFYASENTHCKTAKNPEIMKYTHQMHNAQFMPTVPKKDTKFDGKL